MKGTAAESSDDKSTSLPGHKNPEHSYLKSEEWKCTKSPTGAHFWKETSKEYGLGLFHCQYCSIDRTFSTSRW